MSRLPVYALTVFLSAALPAAAQYTGPGAPAAVTSVKAILDNPVDDQRAVLRGAIVRQLSADKYMFSDGAHEVKVDIDTKTFAGQPVSETSKVEILGEVDKDLMGGVEVDVETLRVLD